MKHFVPFVALAAVGIIWTAERLLSARLADELARLHQQHEALQSLTRERGRLTQRLRESVQQGTPPQTQSPSSASANLAVPDATSRSTLPLGNWVNARGWAYRGQATPQASIESALWAAAGGDVAALKKLILVPEETRATAAALLASLPDSYRMSYPSPDDLISTLTIKRIPLGEAQLVWLNQQSPDNATVCVFLRDPLNPMNVAGSVPGPQEAEASPPQLPQDFNSVSVYLSLRRDGGSWRLVVPPAAIGTLVRDLSATPTPSS